MSALEVARRMLKQATPPDAINANDADSPPSAASAKPLIASTAFTASVPPNGDGASAPIIGLTTLWQKTLRYRVGCGDRTAAKELAELEAYLGACDRGEIVLPAHPSDEALREWNRLADERHRAKHPKQ